MNPNSLIFPYECRRPRHGVHLGCYLQRIITSIDNRASILLFEHDSCPICLSRITLSILRNIEETRPNIRFPFHRLPSISALGTVENPDPMWDPSHDYDLEGDTAQAIICSDCEEHPMELGISNAITAILRTVSRNLDYKFELDPAGDVFIDILSLQDILPRNLYFFSDIIAPFSCSHPIHAGCYFRFCEVGL